jgi:hypothetical protein
MTTDIKKLKKSYEAATRRIGYEGKELQYTLHIGEDEKYNSIEIFFSNMSITLDLLWLNERQVKKLMRLIESKGVLLSIKDIKEFQEQVGVK